MRETDNKEFLFHEILPDEKLSFGKFSSDGRFFIFLTDEDRYLKSYLHAGSASGVQKLYLYSASENELHFLGEFRGDYSELWFSTDVRYAAIARAEMTKNLIVFNLETLETRDVSVKPTDAERRWHKGADTADGYLHCNYGFHSLNFTARENGDISLRWFLSMRYGPDGGPGATYGSANHVYFEAEVSADGRTRVLQETFGIRSDHDSYAYATDDGKYYVYAGDLNAVYRSTDNAIEPDKYAVVDSTAFAARIYDSADAEPPALPPRPLDLDAAERFSKFHDGEKSVLIAALVYEDFTVWRLNLPPDTRRLNGYVNEIIERVEKKRRRELKKEMSPRSATWREILLAAALFIGFAIIYGFCNR